VEQQKLSVEYVPIDSVVPDPANARRHPEKNMTTIKGSLARLGQRIPIVVTADNVIRKGNGTWQAAKDLGWKEIAVVRAPDLQGVEAIAFAIADNRSSELAEWNPDILQAQLEGLSQEFEDLESIGFDAADLDTIFKDIVQGGDLPLADASAADDFSKGEPVDVHNIRFTFGNHSGLVGREIYDSFTKKYRELQTRIAEPMLGDVLRAWLNV
jgi:ParB-like chromosome segregation protein Spo0J